MSRRLADHLARGFLLSVMLRHEKKVNDMVAKIRNIFTNDQH